MSGYKYSCPYCGQHIEYTDVYSGQQMPCPACGHAIVFPAVPPGSMTSSLSLARDIPQSDPNPPSRFVKLLLALQEYKHWKVVGICLLSLVLLSGAALLASKHLHSQPTLATAGAVPPAGPARGTADTNSLPADPQPAPVAADPTPPSQPAPGATSGRRRGGRGGRGGRQGGQQAGQQGAQQGGQQAGGRGGARGGRQARATNSASANNNNQ